MQTHPRSPCAVPTQPAHPAPPDAPTAPPDLDHRPAVSACRADCVLPSGDSLLLLVTELSLGGAFVVSMMPPSLGARMNLTLLPKGRAPVGPIDSRVIGLRLDPSDARRSGFELIFPAVDDPTFDDLADLVARFEVGEPHAQPAARREQGEKRQFPRVGVSLEAAVACACGSYPARIHNLSMTGAMVTLDPPDPASAPPLGPTMSLELTIASRPASRSITLHAEVVRVGQGTGNLDIGLRFLHVRDSQSRRLEALILDAIWTGSAPLA